MRETEPSHHPATAWVNLDRVRENFKALRSHAGTRAVIPVLKANAYGHGAIAVAKALDPLGVAMYAVAYVDEAIALREAGIETPLLVLTGFGPDQIDPVFRFHLTPVISTPEQVAALQALPQDEDRHRLGVHVKVDTGMSRLPKNVGVLDHSSYTSNTASNLSTALLRLSTSRISQLRNSSSCFRRLARISSSLDLKCR